VKAGAPESRPVLPPGIPQYFLPAGQGGHAAVYTPVILGAARVSFADAKLGVDATRELMLAAPIGDGAVPVDWGQASTLDIAHDALRQEPEAGASYLPLPAAAAQPKSYAIWTKALAARLAQTERIELLRHAPSKLTSGPGESERDFRIRAREALRAARDEAVDAMRRKFAPKQAALVEKLRRAEVAVGRESEQASHQKLQTAVSFGATVLGALFGRKAVGAGSVGRATTTARGVGRSMKEASDVKRATENVESVKEQIAALEAEVAKQADAIAVEFDTDLSFERVSVAPRRGQVAVHFVGLGWDPQ
jgi:hypothetical protein